MDISKDLSAPQMDAIVNKLVGKKNALEFLLKEELISASEACMVSLPSVKLGLLQTPCAYFTALSTARHINRERYGSENILYKITCSKEEVDLDLEVLSVRELGFKDGTEHIEHIYAKGLERGLELCPAEVGPALRLQYLDQLDGESLHIAMEPVVNGFGFSQIFCVYHYDRHAYLAECLSSWDFTPSTWRFHPGDLFVFVRPK